VRYLLALVALILAGLGAGCSGGPGQTNPAEAAIATNKPSLSFDNIILTESDQQGRGQLWELKAKRAEYSRDGKVAVVTGIEGAFFEDGIKTLLVKATKGQIQTEARVIVLSGVVVARSVQRKVYFTTPELRWLPDQDRVEATGGVTLTDPVQGIIVKGERMEGDLAGDLLNLSGKVTATQPKRNVVLTATTARWQVEQGQIQAQTVTVQDPVSRLQAPVLDWNLKAQTLIANQGMAYQHQTPRQDLTATTARWDQPQNLLTVSGNVDYRQGQVRVQGNSAVADLKAGTVQIKGQVRTSLETLALK